MYERIRYLSYLKLLGKLSWETVWISCTKSHTTCNNQYGANDHEAETTNLVQQVAAILGRCFAQRVSMHRLERQQPATHTHEDTHNSHTRAATPTGGEGAGWPAGSQLVLRRATRYARYAVPRPEAASR